MSIGERIAELRTQCKMSQSDLAEALDVSRQSISKWETDSSVPELEKLVMLCDIFGVSMDMLVRGIEEDCKPESNEAAPQITAEEKQKVVHIVKFETRKIIGILLFACTLICVVLGAFAGDLIAGFLLATPFIVCGIICLSCKKRAGLWCAWTVYLYAEVFLRFATGVSSGMLIALMRGHANFGINVIVSIAELLLIIGLAAGTVWSFRNENIRISNSSAGWLAAGWSAFILLRGGLGIMMKFIMIRSNNQFVYLMYIVIKDWILYIVLVVLLIWTYHWWKKRKQKSAL